MKKFINDKLYVHIDRFDGVHWVGEVEFDENVPGGFYARFRYSQEWLNNTHAFSLDPINLPLNLGTRWIETDNKYIRLGVIFDAGPDMWGRRVVQSQGDDLGSTEQQLLLMGRGNGVGALLFATSEKLSRANLPTLSTLPCIEDDLLRVHQAAHNVFSKVPLPDHLQGLLDGSWSMGGARAKAVMRDKDDGIWIVKFSEPGDRIDRQRGELANLEMAREIGLEVPECYVTDTELGSVFLIRRFDRTTDLQRLHFASAISLVSAVPQDKRLNTAFDEATFSYAKLASIISQVSPDPDYDRMQLFARMVLNICVHNTDDHLKNMAFIEHVKNGQNHMRLAPVFDVVTQSQAQHFLRIGQRGRIGSLENALSEYKRFRLSAKGANEIVQKVVNVVARRQEFYEAAGLSIQDIEVLNQLIEPICPAQLMSHHERIRPK